jgi:membrane-associated protease RseP (regulator of RpoE activity)
MRDSSPDSSDSPPPSATPSAEADAPDSKADAPPRWRTNALLFAATVASVFFTGLDEHPLFSRPSLLHGLQFAGSLLGILVAHESGHFIAARIHKVTASLPYFIPLPAPISPFGTMGAVIRMSGRIATRRALLDIGASGPLAGLVLAIPLYVYGVAHSGATAVTDVGNHVELGSSILTRVVDHFVAPAVPDGQELMLSPIAFGAWAGMFVTMINLLPVGQLDGGHVAYALFGPKQDGYTLLVHRSMLAFFFVSLASYVLRDVRAGLGLHHLGDAVNNSMFWLVWFEVLAVLGTLSSRGQGPAGEKAADAQIPIRTRGLATLSLALLAFVGHERSSPFLWIAWFVGLGLLVAMEAQRGVLRKHTVLDHPPTGSVKLDPVRTVIAIVTLAFFALLFMPTPMSQ